MSTPNHLSLEPIAIIGVGARLPGAPRVEQFWKNLASGVESIERIPEEMIESRRDPQGRLPPTFVPRGTFIPDTELFDCGLFGVSVRDAKLMDPQQRLFIEQCWVAAEDAGYPIERLGQRVGVYGGAAPSRHVLDVLENFGQDSTTMFEALAIGSTNAMAMRTSHLFDLRGESIYLHTACSTSLVGIDLACRALRLGRIDAALAGAVALWIPQQVGYEHMDGMIQSSDGHVRAFDARADGTVWGFGVAVVALKRLDHALRDGDPIRAVIRAVGVNNDGATKQSFAAPSAAGQAEVIALAYREAGLDPRSVSFVEAHGTGTSVGDPIEVAGLNQVFGGLHPPHTVPLGSVKPNIGHLDPAAGVASLLKVTLSLQNELIPATLHFETPNPKIEFERGPFFVNQAPLPWPRQASAPRRAAINSFGVGGTNAHLVVEEAPLPAPRPADPMPYHLVTLSGRSSGVVQRMATELAEHLHEHPETVLADVALTRNLGRRHFDVRRAVVAGSTSELARLLAQPLEPKMTTGGRVAFLFPGQGAQRLGMLSELLSLDSELARDLEDALALVERYTQKNPRRWLHPAADERAGLEIELAETRYTQPMLFAVEYSLARAWSRLGVNPVASLGHSVGEYVAACLAGVLRPTEAIKLLALRGALIQGLPRGAMLAIHGSGDLAGELAAGLAVDVAAVNGPEQTVLSGSLEAIDALQARAEARGAPVTRLKTSHAFHSRMLDPILKTFEAEVQKISLKAPQQPYISNLSGDWIRPEEATSPKYWADHLRQPVRFAAGLNTLASASDVWLEVGPGEALTRLAAGAARAAGKVVAASLPPRAPHEHAGFLGAVGQLYEAGVSVDLEKLSRRSPGRRVSLPAYPFEGQWCAFYAPDEVRTLGPAAPTEAKKARPDGPRLEPRPEVPGQPYVAPQGPEETKIAEVMGRLLGIEPYGASDDLLEFGGHSLVVVHVIGELGRAFGVPITAREVLELRTPEQLGQRVKEKLSGKDPEEES